MTGISNSFATGELSVEAMRRREFVAKQRALRSAPLSPATTVAAPAAETATRSLPAVVVVSMRIFLIAGWLRAGVEKLIDGTWWSGGALRSFITTNHSNALPFFRPAMDHVFSPLAVGVAFIVLVGEIGCGIAMCFTRTLHVALRCGVVLNVAFILSGVVNPSCFYLVMEGVLLLAIAEGAIGTSATAVSRRTYALAGVSFVIGLLMVPFVRTLAPAKVIADPGIMLVFLSFMVAFTSLLRCAARPAAPANGRIKALSDGIVEWAQAGAARQLQPASNGSGEPGRRVSRLIWPSALTRSRQGSVSASR